MSVKHEQEPILHAGDTRREDNEDTSPMECEQDEELILHDVEDNDEIHAGSSGNHEDEDDIVDHDRGNPSQRRATVVSIVSLTLCIEGFTCLLRFGFGMESTRDTAGTVGRLTFGIRIHHGYMGVLILLVYKCGRSRPSTLTRWMKNFGWSLIASDLIHHFLVLWPLTGSPHFDLVYPK